MEPDYDDEYEDDDQASEFMDRARAVVGEPVNRWDVANVFVWFVRDISMSFVGLFSGIHAALESKSVAHDEKRQFEREASLAIEAITGGQDG